MCITSIHIYQGYRQLCENSSLSMTCDETSNCGISNACQ